jgi:hypothetical protein
VSASGDPPRGKTPGERHVDVPAAPLPDALEELMRRPPRNTPGDR